MKKALEPEGIEFIDTGKEGALAELEKQLGIQ